VPTADIRDALGHSSLTMTNNYISTTSTAHKKAILKNSAARARRALKVVGR
jgi:hypothetical protein